MSYCVVAHSASTSGPAAWSTEPGEVRNKASHVLLCRHWATWLQLPLVLALFSALLGWFGEHNLITGIGNDIYYTASGLNGRTVSLQLHQSPQSREQ